MTYYNAISFKPQGANCKPQAVSLKPQAIRRKPQAASINKSQPPCPHASLVFAILLALLIPTLLHAQEFYPAGYFRPPLDSRLLLSGTFGEIRTNHFHSGIDIKTGGAEGAKVYAIADGYVSRIKVSAYGFGKALYITHPNGYMSVYGHLKGYNKAIGDFVKAEHYRRESFEIEMFPEPGEFPVKKGEVVAYSGNSGSSGGPHLHFEIRDALTQKIINPLLFGFDVKDFYRPRITSVKIYPEGENSSVNGSGKAIRFLVEGWGVEHRLAGNPVIKVSGDISFAIQVFDQQNDTDNKNGPYAYTLYIDSVKVYEFRMETFAFDQTRYVNSLLDYEELIRNNARLIRTCIDPGNKLDIYGKVIDRGIFTFADSLKHTIRYEVTDVPGNMAVLEFEVQSVKPLAVSRQTSVNLDNASPFSAHPSLFHYNASNHFENPSIILDAPEGAFYKSFQFEYDSLQRVPGTFSAVHKIHNKYTPVHDYIVLGIKPMGLPEKLRSKALVVKVPDEGGKYTSAGGNFDETDGFVRTKIREFGNYAVAIDTVPPKIRPLNAESFKNLESQTAVKFSISDELSGIFSYRATLNGKWILMDYDAKNDLLVYLIDEHLLPGQNAFELKVVDSKGNQAVYKGNLTK